MKKALLFALALVAVPPVVVEAQEDESARLVNRLLQSRACELVTRENASSTQDCTYDLGDVAFRVSGNGTPSSPGNVTIFEVERTPSIQLSLLGDCLVINAFEPEFAMAVINRKTASVETLLGMLSC